MRGLFKVTKNYDNGNFRLMAGEIVEIELHDGGYPTYNEMEIDNLWNGEFDEYFEGINFSEGEIRTMIDLFGTLSRMPYKKLNTEVGSMTIQNMNELYKKLMQWYYGAVENEEG